MTHVHARRCLFLSMIALCCILGCASRQAPTTSPSNSSPSTTATIHPPLDLDGSLINDPGVFRLLGPECAPPTRRGAALECSGDCVLMGDMCRHVQGGIGQPEVHGDASVGIIGQPKRR